MNVNQSNPLLENLADIHIPANVSYWPPAPGWWILLCLLILVLYFLVRLLKSMLKTRRYRKNLLNELQQVQRHWQKQNNIILTAAQISTLLRRYFVDQDQRSHVAGQQQMDWFEYLQNKMTGIKWNKYHQQLILEFPYQDPLVKFDQDESIFYSKEINNLISEIRINFKKSKIPGRFDHV